MKCTVSDDMPTSRVCRSAGAGIRCLCAFLAAGLLAWLWTNVALAYPDVRFKHLGMEDGLSQSSVQAIVQDRQGYLWFGTQYGLDRYDGYTFVTHRHDPANVGTLSNDTIQGLHVASDGMLWVLTRNGIDRMDPVSGQVQRMSFDPAARGSGVVPARAIQEDSDGNLVFSGIAGAVAWNAASQSLRPIKARGASVDPRFLRAELVALDRNDRHWISNMAGLWRVSPDLSHMDLILAARRGETDSLRPGVALLPEGLLAFSDGKGLRMLDPVTGEVVAELDPRDHGYPSASIDMVAVCELGMLWLLLPEALLRYQPQSGKLEQIMDLPPYPLGADRPRRLLDVHSSLDGYQWLAGEFGIVLYDPGRGTARLFRHDAADNHSPVATTLNTGYRLFIDRQGTVWVGSGLGGVSRFAPGSARFQQVREAPAQPGDAVENIVRAVLEHHHNDEEWLWTGLDGDGLRGWRRGKDGRYRLIHRLSQGVDKDIALPDYRIHALAGDPVTGDILVASSSALFVVSPDAGQLQVLARSSALTGGGRLQALHLEPDGRRLLFNLGPCLFELRRESGVSWGEPVLRHCRSERSRLSGDDSFDIVAIRSASHGDILLAGLSGLTVLPADGRPPFNLYPAGLPGRYPGNYLFALTESSPGEFWLGSRDAGLARMTFDGEQAQFEWFDIDDGLADRTVYAIELDDEDRLWLSSNRGLTRFDPVSGRIRHFTTADGLQSLEFNHTVAHAGQSGRLYFGGINGVNVFRPSSVVDHPDPPLIHLQQVRVNDRPLAMHNPLWLTHDENYLVIDYVGLHFANPGRNRYRYRLVGLEETWVDAGNRRQARYPGLTPGRYAFAVQAANSDGIWSDVHTLLEFTIKPPPWLTPAAFVAYVAAGLALLTAVAWLNVRRRRVLESLVRQRTRQLAEKNRLVARQAGELEAALEARTSLFANISHEFRTPLTLIQAALDRIERSPEDRQASSLARRYLSRLLRLVDQLLDLSKLAWHEPTAASEPWPLDQLISLTADAFRELARHRQIRLTTRLESGWITSCPREHVERIALNLIGNALKFTPAHGAVEIRLLGHGDGALLEVHDTGVGIAKDLQQQVFERFHRTPAGETGRVEGAGIGLSLVREAAQAMGGHIELESSPGEGSIFRVWIPASKDTGSSLLDLPPAAERAGLDVAELEAWAQEGACAAQVSERQDRALGTLLVVEDNPDLRQYLVELLHEEWEVLEAGNGHEAIVLANEHDIDVILSDVMMPEMDGLELLSAIRDDIRTSHIPLLILTARQDEETRQRGLKLAADGILGKPFDAGTLRLKLRSMIDARDRIRRRILAELHKPAETAVDAAIGSKARQHVGSDLSRRDQHFLKRVEQWLDKHFSDPEVTVARMSDDLAMDARTLQRKLKALTGHSPGSLLQSHRIREACRLLAASDTAVQQVAANCGFSSAQYFSRVFAKSMGCTPSAWRESRRSIRDA